MRITTVVLAAIVAAPVAASEPASVDAPRLMKHAIETGEADARTALLIAQWVLTARPEEIVPAFVDVLTSAVAEMKTGDEAWDEAAQAVASTFARLLEDGASHRHPDTAALMQDLAPVVRAAVPAVVQALGEVDPDVREALSSIVGTFAAEAGPAVPVLVGGLKDRDPGARAAAATALGLLGPSAERAVPALKAALQDPDARVRDAAAAALDRIRQR
jgi:HEAT repeat protein